MKAFNLKEYLKNPEKKVVTRDGRGVRIRCTDKRGGNCPIVALVENPIIKTENILTYEEDGRWNPVGSRPSVDSDLDLFFAPEKHEGWVNVYKGENRDYFTLGSMIYDQKEDAERCRIEETCVATVKIEWEDE